MNSPFAQRNSDVPLRLGVMISGGGRTLLNLQRHIEEHDLPARIITVIASREEIMGVARAREAGLEVVVLNSSTCGSPEATDRAITEHLRSRDVELICLAGYMRKVRIDPWLAGRVINIHPALLPSFGGKRMYGDRVHRAVLEHGCKVSGCTVHFVDDMYDNGPIILQRCCPVLEEDTPEDLARRVFAEECVAYPEAVRLVAAGKVSIDGRRVIVRP